MEAAVEGDLEAKRPPYWHVSIFEGLQTANTNVSPEHARGRYRRDQWGYCDALARYCENETARRSSFSAEIHKPVELIRYNIPARGTAEGSLWRVRGCYAGVIPRYGSVLWLL